MTTKSRIYSWKIKNSIGLYSYNSNSSNWSIHNISFYILSYLWLRIGMELLISLKKKFAKFLAYNKWANCNIHNKGALWSYQKIIFQLHMRANQWVGKHDIDANVDYGKNVFKKKLYLWRKMPKNYEWNFFNIDVFFLAQKIKK